MIDLLRNIILLRPRFVFTARRGVSILKQEVRQSQRVAYSKGTFKNLKTRITSYLLFYEYFKIVALPASAETLCLYVQFLGRSMKSVQSIRNYLNGVKIFLIFKEYDFPSLHD